MSTMIVKGVYEYRYAMSNHITSVNKTLITDWFQCNKSITDSNLKAKPSYIFSSFHSNLYNAVTASERQHESTNLPKYIQKYHDWNKSKIYFSLYLEKCSTGKYCKSFTSLLGNTIFRKLQETCSGHISPQKENEVYI